MKNSQTQEQGRAIYRQNESALTLSDHGFFVEQLPPNKTGGYADNNGRSGSPDFYLRGNGVQGYADVYAPKEGTNPKTILDTLDEKLTKQGPIAVVNLDNSNLNARSFGEMLRDPTLAGHVQTNGLASPEFIIVIKNGVVTIIKR
jgi:hypothetical protein